MDIELLMKSFLGLVVILGILIFLLSSPFESKELKKVKNKEDASQKSTPNIDFKHLRSIVNNAQSTKEELSEAMELIIRYYGTMHVKLGIRAHPDSDVYMDVLFKACRHKNITKDIIITFMNALEKLNPTYKKEINDALMRGLNSRGV